MKISDQKFVSLAYTLTVDGKIADQANADKPLDFIYGVGMLLPLFESNIEGKAKGEKFQFTLSAQDGYGEINPDAIVELPKEIFMVEGANTDEILQVDNVLPMGDNQGNRMMGNIKEIKDDVVIMDFNHPMAGKTLNFEGEVVGVRESTPEDIQAFMGGGEGGCGCGDGGCGDGECGDGECSSEGGCNC